MKIAINKQYGGPFITTEGVVLLRSNGCEWAKKVVLSGEVYPDGRVNTLVNGFYFWCEPKEYRTDPILVECMEKYPFKKYWRDMQLVEVPDNIDWEIEEYDGIEWVSQVHKIWS